MKYLTYHMRFYECGNKEAVKTSMAILLLARLPCMARIHGNPAAGSAVMYGKLLLPLPRMRLKTDGAAVFEYAASCIYDASKAKFLQM